MNNRVTVTDHRTGHSVDLEVLEQTQGPGIIDIRGLYRELGLFTYDPGFTVTASCWSKITYLDGEGGELLYRGYPIEQLVEQSSFIETCYLLLCGELPTEKALEEFSQEITRESLLQEEMKRFYEGFRSNAHPMAIMVGVVGALSAFYHDYLDIHNRENRLRSARLLIAKMPTIAAWSYRYANGLPFIYPKSDYSLVENFLYMMFSLPTDEYKPDPLLVRALEVIMIAHADHEQNASTSTVRQAGSSEANPFASIAAGIASLWGPSHGGANEAVIEMLEEIRDSGKPLQHYVDRAKDRSDRFRLMGFGHRIYKNYDPRAKILRKLCHQVIEQCDDVSPEIRQLLDLALELEQVALNDDYFRARKLYPNVDFYSGIILLSIGIPLNMFTVIFAMARTVGWISQWNEMIGDQSAKIARPRQLYMGDGKRDYLSVGQRRDATEPPAEVEPMEEVA